MNYRIKTIPQREQAYHTPGNYWQTKNGIELRVSDMHNPTYELAVALHELIESHLCLLAGIKFKDIDDFDIAYEKARPSGIAPCGCTIQDEPGKDIHAPYHDQHIFATKLEKEFMNEASYIKYDRTVENL
jgi:hypothetical protein